MTPPISIDGTDITGATIDGQDVQEITVDGQTVFTAGPDIPDSEGLHEWLIDEETGTTAADRVGSADFSFNGNPSWTSGTGVGDYYLDFDGSDDQVFASASDLSDWGDTGGVMFQTNVPSEPTDRQTAFRQIPASSRLYFFLIDSNNNDISLGLASSGNITSHGLDFTDWTFGNWTGIGLFWDSGNYDLHLYDFPTSTITTGSGTYSGSVQQQGDLTFMIEVEGGFDFPRIFDDYKTPSTVQSKFEELEGFYA